MKRALIFLLYVLILSSGIFFKNILVVNSEPIVSENEIKKSIISNDDETFHQLLVILSDRVIKNRDVNSLNIILNICDKTDGVFSEMMQLVLSNVYLNDKKFFLLHSYQHRNAKNAYSYIIYKVYSESIENSKYPSDYQMLKSYGNPSVLFLSIYELYLKNGL